MNRTSDWPRVELASVIDDAQPGYACGKRDADGIIQLRMNNVQPDGRFNWKKVLRVPAEQKKIEKYALSEGDVLFNNTNSAELVGKSAIFASFEETITYSNHFTRLQPDTGRVDRAYLAAWLRHEWEQRTFEHLCNRWVGQAAVKWSKLQDLPFPLPPLPEQRAIARRLTAQMEQVAAARAAAEAQLSEIDAMPAALLREVFDG